MSRMLSHRRYEELKALGADLIEDYALAYPLDPFEVADILGVHVTVHEYGLPPMAAWFCSTTDAYTLPGQSSHGLKFQVHLNGAAPPLRQRFTLMHEVAHLWLDHPRAETFIGEVAEAEANFLASYLLAPDALVTAWVPGLTVTGIAEEFQVSEESAGLIHKRVLRMLTANAQGRHYNRRIASAALKRVEALGISSGQRSRGSA